MTQSAIKKAPAIASQIITDNGQPCGVLFEFADGRLITVTADDLSQAILEHAVWHGLKQKIGDAAALSRNPDTGRSATLDDKHDAMLAVLEQLKSGHWNKPREGSGGSTGGLLAQAIANLRGKPVAAIREWLAGKSKEEQAALRANAKIAEEIARIQASRVSDDIDSDALLDEI